MTEPLKVGLIGTGSISRMHLPGYQLAPDEVRLTAVCDIREDAARRFADEAGVDAVFSDAEQLLAQSDVDAVDICTIHDQHAPLAIAAARAGKHVLLEKPMAISLDECRAILEATERAGVTFMVAQQLRHVPSYVGLRRRIQAGELGRIWSARCDTFLTAALEDGRQPIAPGAGWWGFDGKRGGGGVVTMLAVHHLDLLRLSRGRGCAGGRAQLDGPSELQQRRGRSRRGDAGVRQRRGGAAHGQLQQPHAVGVSADAVGRARQRLDAAA